MGAPQAAAGAVAQAAPRAEARAAAWAVAQAVHQAADVEKVASRVGVDMDGALGSPIGHQTAARNASNTIKALAATHLVSSPTTAWPATGGIPPSSAR